MDAAIYLPVIFVVLMGVAMLFYALLDGYDLGVGMLISRADSDERDTMIASIGPFWDANETWLVLGVGILLIAFPMAHGVILQALYLPVMLMLLGLILRGVSFDFRAKARAEHKDRWDRAFCIGSAIASIAQGFMLGQFIMGFDYSLVGMAFSLLIGFCVATGYMLVGACWLIWKTEGELQKQAVRWARRALRGTAVGVVVVSAATPLVNPVIFGKWFSLPNIVILSPIPLVSAFLFWKLERLLKSLPRGNDAGSWKPLIWTMMIYILCFLGLAFSFFPEIVPGRMTVWEAAASTASLWVILAGALLVLPMIFAYTFFVYRVFSGKVRELRYD
jgi:cytochrome d ubiquinol oxidase subunit II